MVITAINKLMESLHQSEDLSSILITSRKIPWIIIKKNVWERQITNKSIHKYKKNIKVDSYDPRI